MALSVGMKDDKQTHLKCALIASATAATCGNPVDVLKSRTIMLNKAKAGNKESNGNRTNVTYFSLIKEIYR